MTPFISELAQNWEAVDSSFLEVGRKHYYINVCHKVLKRGGASSCPDDAAICSVGESFWLFGFFFFKGSEGLALPLQMELAALSTFSYLRKKRLGARCFSAPKDHRRNDASSLF